MGMSTHVIGFKPPDEKWKKMKAIYDSCNAAGVSVPREVYEFFNNDTPTEEGVAVSEKDLVKAGAVKAYRDDMKDGYDIFTDKLDPDIKIIRVYNSY